MVAMPTDPETTEETITRLQEIADSGVSSVTLDGKTVQYRSRGELDAAIQSAKARSGVRVVRATRWRRRAD